MAAITYDGVSSSQGGNIFKDVSFWLSSRVPIRKSLEAQITANGGTVVPLEKRADMLIADHAKPKFAPPGSYSWKFIEDSVKNGIIQIKDRYLIGLDPSLPRPVGGGGGIKGTRTAFTKADDAVVAKWVLSRSNRTGNKIFQDLEKVNPRHTWQSWRNRFVKTLQPLPMEKLIHLAESAPEEPIGNNEEQVEATPARKMQEPTRKEPAKPIPTVQRNHMQQPEVIEQPEPVPKPAHKPAAEPVVERNTQLAHDATPKSQASDETVEEEEEPLDTTREMFYEDLEQYMAATGVNINLQPEISKTAIELFDLSIAVGSTQKEDSSQGVDGTDWAKVAALLGFDAQDEIAISQLRQCYDESLAEFEEAMADYDEGNEDEAEGELDEQQVGREISPLQEGDWEEESPSRRAPTKVKPTYARSSPPVGVKRTLGQLPVSPSGPGAKRKRLTKKIEIESTPDPEDQAGPQVSSAQNFSPSFRKSLMRQEYVDASEASQQLPPLPPPEDEIQEVEPPEEEDAVFETQPSPSRATQQLSPVLGTDTPADITPSQQIHYEALNPSPIPFSLDRVRQPKKSRNFGRSISYPMHATEAGPSNQHRAVSARQTTPPNDLSSIKKDKKVPRRSLPISFGARAETHKKPSVPAPAPSAAPKRTQTDATRDSTQPTSAKSNHREIDQWIKHYESLGFSRPIVIEGLKRTTLTPGTLATIVMKKLKEGEDVPSHHEGIWTDRDDNDLAFLATVDLRKEPSSQPEEQRHRKARKALRRLTNKHGAERIILRKAFLEAQGTDEQRDSGE